MYLVIYLALQYVESKEFVRKLLSYVRFSNAIVMARLIFGTLQKLGVLFYNSLNQT